MIMTREKGFYKHVFMLMIPLALQNIITFAVTLVDNLIVGSLGEFALSGVYIAIQMQTILHMLVVGLSAALIVLAAQYWGKRDVDSVKLVIGIALRFALGAGLIFLLATLFVPHQILGLFTEDQAVVDEAFKYLAIFRYTYIFFCITQVLIASLRSVENVRIGLYVSVITFFVNIALDFILVFGLLGFPAMGIRGAATATLIARVMETALMVLYIAFIDKRLQMKIADLLRFSGDMTRKFFRYGLPVIMGDLLWGLNNATQGAIIGHLGATATASVSIAGTVFSVVGVAVFGTAGASAIIIGKTVGSGDNEKVKEYAKTLQVLFLMIGVVSGAIMFAVKEAIPLIYPNLTADTKSMTIAMLTVLSVTLVGTAYQMSSLTGIVRAGGATHFVLVNDLIWVWLVVIPSALIASNIFHASPVIVFACLKSDQILKCIVAVIKVNRFKWIKNLTVAHPGKAEPEAG